MVVEPWYHRVLDLSVQVEVTKTTVRTIGVTRFWTSGSGAYRGAIIGPWMSGLADDVARAAHGGVRGGAVNKCLKRVGEFVGQQAQSYGYTGPVGIDAMLVRNKINEYRLVPILEVNPRFTMGRLSLGITKVVDGKGAWLFFSKRMLKKAGYLDVSSFVDVVESTNCYGVTAVVTSGAVDGANEDESAVVTVLLMLQSHAQKKTRIEYPVRAFVESLGLKFPS